MRAQNLAISIPKTKDCDKNCPYCVSKMTGFLKPNLDLFWKNIGKAKTLAKHSNITSVLITGKGEPMQEPDLVRSVLYIFREFPTELQTNGKYLHKNPEYVETLSDEGLNVLAISIDQPEEITEYAHLVKRAQAAGMLVRYTINLTNRFESRSFWHIFTMCKLAGIDQLSLREVTIPTDAIDTKESKAAQEWINKHVNTNFVKTIKVGMKLNLEESGRFLMSLPYGAKLYDLEGISVTWFDYCVQDNNEGDDIRSLIYQEDGHLQTCWNSRASKLF